MLMNIFSYQFKQQKSIICVQLFGSLFFTVNMFMLNAITGGLLNLIGVFRAIVYYNKFKFKNIKPWNWFFIILYILSYFSVFLIFKKEPTIFNIFIEVLPIIAMIVMTLAFSKQNATELRHLALISSPLWLIYNCFNLSIGGILCETFSIISVLSAIIRFKKGIKNNEKTKS